MAVFSEPDRLIGEALSACPVCSILGGFTKVQSSLGFPPDIAPDLTGFEACPTRSTKRD